MRVNTLRGEVPDLGVRTHGDPDLPEALVLDEPFDVLGSPAFRDGLIWPQSRSSMQVGRAVAAEPGMRVLDLCAAPGGKSGHLAALMEDQRSSWSASSATAAGRQSWSARCAAWASPAPASRWPMCWTLPAVATTGSCSTRPAAAWACCPDGRTPAGGGRPPTSTELAGIQRAMLEHARSLLSPGGRLVYSVCTLTRAE